MRYTNATRPECGAHSCMGFPGTETADGSPCRECQYVRERLEVDGLTGGIDRMRADERDPVSEGVRLSEYHGVLNAPFLVLEQPVERVQVCTVYMRLLRDVLQHEGNEHDQATDVVDSGGIDFI